MASADSPAATVIDGRSLRLTSLDKVMYPSTGTTKQEVLGYYAAIAPYLVPHARMRPATRKRYVDGVGVVDSPGKVFFEKNLGSGVPRWVERRGIEHSDRLVTYPLVNDAATLVWCAQMGALELHIPQWRFGEDDEHLNPDRLVLDLDPGPGAGLDACVEVALLCKGILDGVGLTSVPVTSGSKGIHLYAQLDGSQTWQQASQFAHTLARALEADHPDLIVSDMKKSLRDGKVLLDWSQNNGAKTTIAPYSLRGTSAPRVACPREWSEIKPGLAHVDMYEVLARVQASGDRMAHLAAKDGVSDSAPVIPAPRGPVAPAARPARVAGAAQSKGSAPAPAARARASEPAQESSAQPLRPMAASTGSLGQVRGPGWAYEVKWDGYRALASVRGDAVTLTSRNGIDLTKAYPELQELAGLAAVDCVLDGEVVALDSGGRPSFELLQDRARSSTVRARLMLFDVLEIAGESQLHKEYGARREALEALVPDGTFVQVPPPLQGTADEAMELSQSLRLEGIMAKKTASPYLPGIRSSAWIKLKRVQTQEVVIVGWSPGSGNRSGTIGSLLLGVWDSDELKYAGKVGSGFSDRGLRETQAKLAKIERLTPQVVDVPAVDAKGARWTSPVYVGEVAYAEWTSTGRLRQPVWKGWRPDKKPSQVQRES